MPFMARLPGIESSPDDLYSFTEVFFWKRWVDDSSQPANRRLFCGTESQDLDFEAVWWCIEGYRLVVEHVHNMCVAYVQPWVPFPSMERKETEKERDIEFLTQAHLPHSTYRESETQRGSGFFLIAQLLGDKVGFTLHCVLSVYTHTVSSVLGAQEQLKTEHALGIQGSGF